MDGSHHGSVLDEDAVRMESKPIVNDSAEANDQSDTHAAEKSLKVAEQYEVSLPRIATSSEHAVPGTLGHEKYA
jgi:hypothetical protein